MTQVDASEFRQNAAELLTQVRERNDSILIREDGKTIAALVDAEVFARLRGADERFEHARQRIAAAWTDIPEEEGLAEIDRACAEERHR